MAAIALSSTVDGGAASGFKSEPPGDGVNVLELLNPFGIVSGSLGVPPGGGSVGDNGVPISGEGSTGI